MAAAGQMAGTHLFYDVDRVYLSLQVLAIIPRRVQLNPRLTSSTEHHAEPWR